MGFGTIYRSTGRLIARTAVRGVLSSLVLIVPAYMFVGVTTRAFLLDAVAIIERHAAKGAEATPEVLQQIVAEIAGGALMVVGAVMLLVLGATIVQVLVTVDSWDHAVGVRRDVVGWLRKSFGRPFAVALAQVLIIAIMMAMFLFAFAMVSAILSAATGGFGATLLAISSVVVLVFFLVATLFRLHEIVADERGPWRALVSSAALVRPEFWRTIATIAPMVIVFYLAGDIVGLAISSSTPPPVLREESIDLRELGEIYRTMAAGLAPAATALIGSIAALTQFITINLLTALYVDLRARRGDFDFDEAEEIGEAME
jgi:hypothetical protein